MYKFLSSNIKYPNEAQRAGKGAKVYLKFIVSVDGSISDIEVMNPSGFGFDEESVRVVKLMPKWIAAYVNDKKVNSFFTLPIIFKLTNSQGKRF